MLRYNIAVVSTDFTFTYNLDRDLNNYRQSVLNWQRTDHDTQDVQEQVYKQLPIELQNNLENTLSDEEKLQVVRTFLEAQKGIHGDLYQLSTATLETAWELRQKQIIERLETLFEEPFGFEKIAVNFTTLPIRPYNFEKRYLMVGFQQSLFSQLKTIVHELFHFMLHAHYDKYLEDKIDNFEHYETIKEALTVFINSDFLDLVMVADKGYPKEQQLRQQLLQLDREEYDFEGVLDFLVEESRKMNTPATWPAHPSRFPKTKPNLDKHCGVV